jgi:DNA-binding PadR family transcriptional regulator
MEDTLELTGWAIFYYIAVQMERVLGGFESLLLLAIMRLGDEAYGVTIRRELLNAAQKDVTVGAIYTSLSRLEQKGLVESWLGDATATRGGRAKRFYHLTASGADALNDTRRAFERLLEGLGPLPRRRRHA